MIQAGLDYSRNWDADALYRPVPQVRKVRRTYRRSNPQGKSMIKIGLGLFVYALVLVYLCINGSTLGYQIVELERDIHQLETNNQRIEFSIAEKCSLDQIETAAHQLGMEKPAQGIAVAVIPEIKPIVLADSAETSEVNRLGQGPLNKLYNNLVMLAQNNL